MLLTNLFDFIINKDIENKDIFNVLKSHRCLNINPEIVNNFLFVSDFVDNTFKLHLFTKKYNLKNKKNYKDRGHYICSFYLENCFVYNDYNIDVIKNYDKNFTNIDNLIKINTTSENIYSELGIYNQLYNQSYRNLDSIEEVDENDGQYINLQNELLFNILDQMKTGIYTDIYDIRWQIYLSNIITSSYSDGSLIRFTRSSDFKSCKIRDYYFPNIDINNNFDKEFNYIHNFLCDCCNKNINKEENSWHHNIAGDLCPNCYLNKKTHEKKRRKFIYHKIFLHCRKILFKKELENTIRHLNNIKLLSLSINKKYAIQQHVIKEMSSKLFENNRRCCSICLDVLNEDLSSGKCGHIFHTKCIQNLSEYKCPLCKIETDFFKLYLYN